VESNCYSQITFAEIQQAVSISLFQGSSSDMTLIIEVTPQLYSPEDPKDEMKIWEA
jgi:hypothetical protein